MTETTEHKPLTSDDVRARLDTFAVTAAAAHRGLMACGITYESAAVVLHQQIADQFPETKAAV